MSKEKYYISTAIAYTSKTPHIGNVYEAILADSIARFKRLDGYDVFFMTGTDEHGQKIAENAKNAGFKPKEYVDKIANEIKDIYKMVDISYDKFIRTTDKEHKEKVNQIFKILYDKKDIYKGKYEGWYCVPDESFWTETQLLDGNRCPDCGREVKKASEEAYFLKLSNYTDVITDFINKSVYPKSRRNEMIKNFIEPGLKDLCVSRTSFKWGVELEFDKEHVAYVWIDALSNYITGIGYDKDNPSENFKKYWPCDVHIIGKDIARFHTLYWPAILSGIGLDMPKKIYGHPWLLMDNEKMSKSVGNVIYTKELVDFFGVDETRYYVLREMSYNNDGNISYDNMISRINTDLANILGNLVQRVISMIKLYRDSKVPIKNIKCDFEDELTLSVENLLAETRKSIDEFKIKNALENIWSSIKLANKYIDLSTPWVLAKDIDKKDKLDACLYNLAASIRVYAILLQAFIPQTSEKILDAFGIDNRDLNALDTIYDFEFKEELKEIEPLFKRIDTNKKLKEIKDKIAKEEENSKNKTKNKENQKAKELISFDDFSKLEIKVGEVISATKHPNADKLLLLEIDIDGEIRTSVSGISKFYKSDELVGKKLAVVTNLQPAKLRGIESNAMVLAAADKKDLKLLEIDMPKGTEIS